MAFSGFKYPGLFLFMLALLCFCMGWVAYCFFAVSERICSQLGAGPGLAGRAGGITLGGRGVRGEERKQTVGRGKEYPGQVYSPVAVMSSSVGSFFLPIAYPAWMWRLSTGVLGGRGSGDRISRPMGIIRKMDG